MTKDLNNDYINFTKLYLEKTILDKLKIIVNDENLSFNSNIVNDFGKSINVGKEISEYIDVMGEDLIKDFNNINNKIDEWFFDYKSNENYYNSNIDKEETINKKEELKNLQKELNTLENKIIDNIENTNIIDEYSQYAFKNIVKSIFEDFRNKISTFLNKFKNNTIDNKQDSPLIDNEMKIELLKLDTLSHKILDKLSKDNDISTLRKIAIHPNTSSETLEYIFNKTNDFKIMENLLNNNKTPESVINSLAKNEDSDIKLMALSHLNISEEILLKNSKTEDIELINSLLKNENSSLKVLENIACYNIDNDEVLKNITNHPSCNEDLKDFINRKLEIQLSNKKNSIKEKIKQKQKIINQNKSNKKDISKKQAKANTL